MAIPDRDFDGEDDGGISQIGRTNEGFEFELVREPGVVAHALPGVLDLVGAEPGLIMNQTT